MEIRHLRYFLQTAEVLSFTRAAEVLRINQSTLSHQIKQLEREMGPLFERAGRSIHLTSRGKIFRAYAERILNDVRTSFTALAELDNLLTGQLVIGVYRAFADSPLPAVLASFSRNYPGVTLRIYTGNHVDITRRLIDGSLDLAVSYAPSMSEMTVTEPLLVESLCLIVGKQHPYYGRSRISLKKLASETLVSISFENRQRQSIQRCLSARGITPSVVIEANSTEAVLAMVKHSTYSTICPPTYLPGLHSIQLPTLPLKRSTILLWRRRDTHRSVAAQAIASMIKSAYAARKAV